jgi:ketosteroid isomerase-like protein
MKKAIPVLLIVGFAFFACNQKQNDLSKQAQQEIIKADIAMSDGAAKEGFFKTLLLCADDSVVKMKEGEYPVIGKVALEKYWSGKNDFKNLTWEPFKAEASKSGDMGYTLGKWKMQGKDSTFYGNYYTIWKKQSDGSWKFVVDGGNNGPKPIEK